MSVVIPAWGEHARKYLTSAVASIALQSPRPRIVIVDNAADPPIEDGCWTVVRSETRLSVGAARSLGLDAVDTTYVMFWDADDEMLPGVVARQRAVLVAHPSVTVVGSRLLLEDGTVYHWPRALPQRLSHRPGLYAALNAVTSQFASIGALMRTAELRSAGAFPAIDIGDDRVAGVAMAVRGRVVVLDDPGRLYRRHPDSISADWSSRHVLRGARAVRHFLAGDPALPSAARWAVPALAPAQWFVLLVLRPLRLRLARRRVPVTAQNDDRALDDVSVGAPG